MVLDTGDYWVPELFQDEIVEDIFSGVPEMMVVIPEGNAKTTLLGGVNLYFADFKPTANCLVAAASREQAEILFSQAAGLVYRSPGFDQRFRVFEGYRRIVAHRSRGKVQVKAADDRTGDGAIFDLATIDEPHRARDLSLWRTWRGKVDKRGGQILGISTAGEPGSEFEETRAAMHRSATDSVTTGRHTRSASPDALIHDWRLSATDDPDDMRVVKLANPLSTITEETLARKRRAPSMTLPHWSRFSCNIPTRQAGMWLDERTGWDLGGSPAHVILAGASVVLAYDPAYTFDTAALVALQPTGDWQGRAMPVEIFKPEEQDGGTIPNWKVKEAILAACQRWRVNMVGYDYMRGFVEAAEELEHEHDLTMVRVPMSSAIWAPLTASLRAAIQSGSIEHPCDAEFTSHVLNGETKESPHGPRLHGRVKARVDALITLGMACFLAWGSPDAPERSPYEHKDLLILR